MNFTLLFIDEDQHYAFIFNLIGQCCRVCVCVYLDLGGGESVCVCVGGCVCTFKHGETTIGTC